MLTLALQCVVAVLTVVFAVLAAGVARARTPLPEAHRAAWVVATVDFAGRGALLVVQNATAVWAFHQGPGTPFYGAYLRWLAPLNAGVAFIAVAAAWGLAVLPFLGPVPARRLWAAGSAAALGVFGAGVYVGWESGGLSASHVAFLALLNAVELVGILLTLLLGLYRYTLDRYLWVALCVYAVHLALNVVWLTATIEFFSHRWYPPQVAAQYYTAFTYLAAVALARRRRGLARAGGRVTSLLELPGEHRQATFG